MEIDKKILGIGTFIILLTIGTTWIINESIEKDGVIYYPYECNGKIGYCFKLSAINDDGLQTRCYYNDTYKICSLGWTLFEGREIIGEEIEEEKDFLNFTEYKITDLYCDDLSCNPICFVIHNETKYCNEEGDIVPYKRVCIGEEENITCSIIQKTNKELEKDIKDFEDAYISRVNLRIELNKPKPFSIKLLKISGCVKRIEVN